MAKFRAMARWTIAVALLVVAIALAGVLPRDWLDFAFLPVSKQLASQQYQALLPVLPTLITQEINNKLAVTGLMEENNRLKKLLRWSQGNRQTVRAGEILNWLASDRRQLVAISVGQDQGVMVGQAVVTPDGWLLGKVAAVTSRRSEVALVTDRQFTVPARVAGSPQAAGLVTGSASQAVVLRYVPKEAQVAVGDLVVTNGLDPLVPPGVLLGTVSSITAEPTDLFQTVGVTPLAQLGTLTTVAVIIK